MPRSIWSGSITFGLVNAPVRIYSAIEEHKLHFHFLHTKDDSPIGYQNICKQEGKPVEDSEIVKAFEYKKGEYVYMEDADFEAAKVDGYKTIDITDFVPYEDVDPIFFAKTYYVGPDEGAERVYSLLARAMEESGLAAVAKFVMRDQQHLGLLRVRDGVITLEQLYFADEIRPVKEIKAAKRQIDKRELEMAGELIDSFTGRWDPTKYEDTYRDELMAVIRAKRKGKDVHAAADLDGVDEAPDLITALRESIERSHAGKRPAPKRKRVPASDLNGLPKDELEERAREAKVPGRSKMTKRELVEALEGVA
ncbi:MAG: Ku protein [Gaiellaceae bacterium]